MDEADSGCASSYSPAPPRHWSVVDLVGVPHIYRLTIRFGYSCFLKVIISSKDRQTPASFIFIKSFAMSAPTLEDSAAKPEKMSRFHIVGKVLSHESDEQREKDKAEEKLKKQEEKEKARKAKEKKRYYKLHPEEAYKDATLSEEERFKLWNKAKDEERKRGYGCSKVVD